MDGGLSQDEINALLAGINLSDDDEAETVGSNTDTEGGSDSLKAEEDDTMLLTDVEKDAIGEIANISMGSSATTLYSLVNRKVNITTPVVEFARWHNLLDQYERPCVFIQIKYTVGLDGTNILILKEHDVKVITDLMMGGDGTNTDGELGELHLSAISEAMNQMMGASATSLSTMMQTKIDISPPEASLLDLTHVKNGEDISPFLGGQFIKISFRMQIDDLVDSSIMQLYPVEFARRVVATFMNSQGGGSAAQEPKKPEAVPSGSSQPNMDGAVSGAGMGMNPQMMNGMQMGMPMGMNPQMMNGMPMGMQNVNVQPAQFQSFASNNGGVLGQENIGLIMDVPLNITVELGRTTKSISEILDFAPGTVIELERIAGEPIDVLVNGKFMAKGEVVVIEESFAVRITEIIK